MLMSRERRTATRTLRGWAMSVLKEVGAVRECEEHGWMQDRTDPHARERAIDIARRDPLPGFSPEAAAAAGAFYRSRSASCLYLASGERR